jgi:hypothetical protein
MFRGTVLVLSKLKGNREAFLKAAISLEMAPALLELVVLLTVSCASDPPGGCFAEAML